MELLEIVRTITLVSHGL